MEWDRGMGGLGEISEKYRGKWSGTGKGGKLCEIGSRIGERGVGPGELRVVRDCECTLISSASSWIIISR